MMRVASRALRSVPSVFGVRAAQIVAMVQRMPTREEARHALSGNLCRCAAYDNYLNGVMRACGNTAEIHHGA